MIRNKDMCLKCKYHSFFGSKPQNMRVGKPLTKEDKKRVMCYYSVLSNKGTALKRGPKDTVIDSRGYDPNHCELFEKGKPER